VDKKKLVRDTQFSDYIFLWRIQGSTKKVGWQGGHFQIRYEMIRKPLEDSKYIDITADGDSRAISGPFTLVAIPIQFFK